MNQEAPTQELSKKGAASQSIDLRSKDASLAGPHLFDTGPPLRAAIAQIKSQPTRIKENESKILSAIERGKAEGVDLLIFPELTIPGYLAHDHFEQIPFLQACKQSLDRIVSATEGSEMTVLVGFADFDRDGARNGRPNRFNSVAVIRDGQVHDVVDKTLLPDYDIFWESRYFSSAKDRKIIDVQGHKIGVQICEDLFDGEYPVKVSDELAALGAEAIVNLSCSPFHVGKVPTRYERLKELASTHKIPVMYANVVGAQDGYEGEVVFDGRSLVVSRNGTLGAIGKGFEEDFVVVDLHQPTEIPLPTWTRVEETYEALVLGLRDYCERNGFTRVYIGLSGGIDSAVTAAIAVEALGKENVIGVTMPSHITSSDTLSDAELLAENLGIECRVRPIGDLYRAWFGDAAAQHGEMQSITKQNIQARMRGDILMEYTNEDRGSMLLSTGNKTEIALGYCTLYGDMCGGLDLLADVSKLEVYELARFHNDQKASGLIPETTITRAPSAELEEDQTDSDNLPADYDVLSPLVDAIIEEDVSRDELVKRYGKETVDRVAKLIDRAEYKRRQAAPGVRVTKKAFGAGRRFPVDSRFARL